MAGMGEHALHEQARVRVVVDDKDRRHYLDAGKKASTCETKRVGSIGLVM